MENVFQLLIFNVSFEVFICKESFRKLTTIADCCILCQVKKNDLLRLKQYSSGCYNTILNTEVNDFVYVHVAKQYKHINYVSND